MNLKERLLDKYVVNENGCWLYTGYVDELGYGIIHDNGPIKAHRASWIVHKGPIPEGMHVLHSCDTRNCINPDDLFLGTHQDNMADRDAKGRMANVKGSNHPGARLTEEDVLKIRHLATIPISKAEIGRRYSVTAENICRIISRKTWRHI